MKLRLLNYVLNLTKRDVEVEFMGAKFVVSPHDLIGRHLILGHGFEKNTIKKAQDIMRTGGVFIDIGANIGLYSIILAQQSGVHCVAIEPSPLNFNYLRRNSALNGTSNVTLVNGALAAAPGVLPMQQWIRGNAGTVRVTGPDHRGAEEIEVSFHFALPIAQVLHALQIRFIRCLKIDVEGFEINVLKGLDFNSDLRPEHIIVEFIEPITKYDGCGRSNLFDFLKSRGYRATDVLGQPVEEIDSSYLPFEYNLIFSSTV